MAIATLFSIIVGMKKLPAVIALAVVCFAFRIEAVVRCGGTSRQQITVNSGQSFDLAIAAIPGALDYEIQRSTSWKLVRESIWLLEGDIVITTVRPAGGVAPTFIERLFNGDPALTNGVYYVATATNSFIPTFQPCAQDFFVSVLPDPLLARDSTRLVVPVVGSLRGANGSVFRTRVVLENLWDTKIEGSLVFRATAGGAATTLRYSLDTKTTKVYDDVVLAIGADGLGSLDVVPDPTPFSYLAPRVTARLNSLAPGGGSFGTEIPSISISDREFGAVWSAPDRPTFLIGDTTANRYNIGVRALADEVSLTAIHFGADGQQKTTVQRTYAADYHEQIPLTVFLGTSIATGDTVQFIASRTSGPSGGAILYLASTDNLTNDVQLDVPRPAVTSLKPTVVACSDGLGCRLLD